jgi:hypothetical protein
MYFRFEKKVSHFGWKASIPACSMSGLEMTTLGGAVRIFARRCAEVSPS